MIAAVMAMAVMAPQPAVRCGAVERPGIAEQAEDGAWHGAAVDLCRKLAAARGAEVSFHLYRTVADLNAARGDDLAVLSATEMASGAVPRGAPVVTSRQVLLVKPQSPIRRGEALAGQRVCLLVASAAEAALDRWARAQRIAVVYAGFQEPVELRDAFDAGYCAAMAVDAADVPGGDGGTREIGPVLAQVPLYVVMRDRS